MYFPTDVEIRLKNFRLNGTWEPVLPEKERVLWIGDSITQGVGSFMGSETFVNIVGRKLKYESLNQGIGGYGYIDRALKPLEYFRPTKIVVALGTNDRSEGLKERTEAFYRKLNACFCGLPVLAITPIWRGDDAKKCEELKKIAEMTESVCRAYPNVRLVNGFGLVPPIPYCFWDNLHPNAWGMEKYADNLIEKIKEIKF